MELQEEPDNLVFPNVVFFRIRAEFLELECSIRAYSVKFGRTFRFMLSAALQYFLKRKFRTIPIQASVRASYSSGLPEFRQVKNILQFFFNFISPCSLPTIVATLNMLWHKINHIELVASGKIFWLNNILCNDDITREFEFLGSLHWNCIQCLQ